MYVDVSSPECRQNHNIKTVNKSCENVAQLKYSGTTATRGNLIHEQMKSKLNSGYAFLPFSSNPSVF
jgi:hypothetical protein